MHRHLLTGVLGLILAIASVASAQSQASKIAPQKGWHTNLDTARALAQKTGKPLLVVFRCDP